MRIEDEALVEDKTGGVVGAALLVAGTCIGAGMLGIPVAVGGAGFLPGMAANLVCWLYMLATGLLFLEATLWMPDGANVLSMAERFLDRGGKVVAGAAFIFLYYCLLTAYLAGGVPIFVGVFERSTGVVLSPGVAYLLFTGGFGAVLAWGTRAVDRVNWLLMVGLVTAYALLLFVGSEVVETNKLLDADWNRTGCALPVLFAAYGFHNIVPSLSTYLARSERKVRLSLVAGTTLPFLIYSLWNWLTVGIVGRHSLDKALVTGEPVNELLGVAESAEWLTGVATFFGFFALVTSLLGVGLSVIDFLADGLGVNRRCGWRRLALCFLTFLPPLIFAESRPELFVKSLGIAGGFGEALLNGALPLAMVWVGRYHLRLPSSWRLPGGRVTLCILLMLTLLVVILEAQHLMA